MTDTDRDRCEERQRNELELIASMFGEHCVLTDTDIGKDGEGGELRGRTCACHIQVAMDDGNHCIAQARFLMPPLYPMKESLEVMDVTWKVKNGSSGKSETADVSAILAMRNVLQKEAREALLRSQDEDDGEESIERCLFLLTNRLSDFKTRSLNIVQATNGAITKLTNPLILVQQMILFHHILSKKKKILICAWSDELSIGGLWKCGYPGVIVAEGEIIMQKLAS